MTSGVESSDVFWFLSMSISTGQNLIVVAGSGIFWLNFSVIPPTNIPSQGEEVKNIL